MMGGTPCSAGQTTYLRADPLRNGIVYFVNGLGGDSWDKFHNVPVPGSVVRYNGDSARSASTRRRTTSCSAFFTRWGRLDSYRMVPRAKPEPAAACPPSEGHSASLNHRLGLLRRQAPTSIPW